MRAEAAETKCAVRGPLVPSRWGGPRLQWGLPDEQHWTTVRSMTPFPSSDPRPRGPNPSGIFQVLHSSDSQPCTSQHMQTFKAATAGLGRNGDVLMRPSESLHAEGRGGARLSGIRAAHTQKVNLYTIIYTKKRGLTADNLTGLQTSRLK